MLVFGTVIVFIQDMDHSEAFHFQISSVHHMKLQLLKSKCKAYKKRLFMVSCGSLRWLIYQH